MSIWTNNFSYKLSGSGYTDTLFNQFPADTGNDLLSLPGVKQSRTGNTAHTEGASGKSALLDENTFGSASCRLNRSTAPGYTGTNHTNFHRYSPEMLL
jgi:hypothetical protein